MKLQLQDYLEAQARTPFKQVLVDDSKEAIVITRELIYRGITYHGPDPRKWQAEGDRIRLPSSQAKPLAHGCQIQLIDSSYAGGRWDHYRISIGEKDYDGFKPWDSLASDYADVPRLEPTEYDSLWCPVRDRRGGRGDYGSLFFLSYGLVQRLPVKGDKNWENSSMIIDLNFENPSRRRMAIA
jgi:hypothetical protein